MYLIARYAVKPKDPKQTGVKGYMKNPDNLRYDEHVSMAKQLRNRDRTAQIILNLETNTVEKCNFEGAKDFKTLFDYFAEAYPGHMRSYIGDKAK